MLKFTCTFIYIYIYFLIQLCLYFKRCFFIEWLVTPMHTHTHTLAIHVSSCALQVKNMMDIPKLTLQKYTCGLCGTHL